MPFELIEEDQMAKKSKKKTERSSAGTNITVIKKSDIERADKKSISTKSDIPVISEKEVDSKQVGPVGPIGPIGPEISKVDRTVVVTHPNVIVKKMHFPMDIYSKNQNEFKKILANYGLSWIRGMMKTYVSKEGVKVLTGMYGSADQTKKVFCIYEGTDKPMTAVIKVIGTGGNFLIDIISFGNRIGCVVEDKDEIYANNVQLTLQEKGEIYVDKKMEEGGVAGVGGVGSKIEDYQKIFEEKFQKYVEERLKEYLDAYKESFERRKIDIETVKFFKRKDIIENVRWGLENGIIKL